MVAGLLAALVAFVLALIARVRGTGTNRSRIQLWVFPAIVAFVVLGEACW
jgi:hypothetical protein